MRGLPAGYVPYTRYTREIGCSSKPSAVWSGGRAAISWSMPRPERRWGRNKPRERVFEMNRKVTAKACSIHTRTHLFGLLKGDICIYTHEQPQDHQGPGSGRVDLETRDGQSPPLHPPDQAGPCHRSPPEARPARGYGDDDRAAKRAETDEVKTMASYIAYLRKETETDYGVEFPDLPGCVSAGKSLEEVKAMAAEALAGHVVVLEEMGETVPAPSTMDRLADDPHRGSAVLFLVDLDPGLLKAERVNVMIPKNLLGRIDAAAGPGNRSRFLVEAAERRLDV